MELFSNNSHQFFVHKIKNSIKNCETWRSLTYVLGSCTGFLESVQGTMNLKTIKAFWSEICCTVSESWVTDLESNRIMNQKLLQKR